MFNTLQDIAQNIQIESNFRISHPDYTSLEVANELVEKLQQLPDEIQSRYLSLQLRNFIHSIYYKGCQTPLDKQLEPSKSSPSEASKSLVENNTIHGLNLEFYEQLHQNNFGTGYFDDGWEIIKQESDHILVVRKNGLTLHIERQNDLKTTEKSAQVGDTVAILMPHNSLEAEFYLAISNVGLPNYHEQIVNIYFNLQPETALELMTRLTKKLNQLAIPFTFKVPCDPHDYKSYDSGILQIVKSHYLFIEPTLRSLYHRVGQHLDTPVPLFTKKLAPGLAIAEAPKLTTPNITESFGIHRCQIVADALLANWYMGKNSVQERLESLKKYFSLLDIEWQHPYLNANSQDIYELLVV